MTEFTYMNCEEYNANTPEERNEDIFIIDQIALANARALLNDDDDNDNMNWNEVEPEDFDPYSNSFQTTHDDIDVEIERTSMQSLNLTPCVVVDTIQGEIKRCNGSANL